MNGPDKIPYISTVQMREVDRLMMEDFGISLLQMMENAGRNLARLAQQKYLKENPKEPIIILAGSGSNGGGALVCACYLQNWGYPVQVCLSKPKDAFKGVPLQQLSGLKKLNLPFISIKKLTDGGPFSLIIDGLIGYSLTGKPSGATAEIIELANGQDTPIISLDVPSGLDGSSGFVTEPLIRAEATMTLALPKTGLSGQEARSYVGELCLADIGIPPQLYQSPSLNLDVVDNLFVKESIIRIF